MRKSIPYSGYQNVLDLCARKVRGYYYSQNMAEKENIAPVSGVLNHDRPNSSKDRPTSSRITGYHAFYKSVAVGI